MLRYIAKRLLHAAATLAGISLLRFFIISFTPGDYVTRLALNPEINEATLNHMKELYGLNQPFYIQYGKWLTNICRLDFGISLAYKIPVLRLITSRLWNTFLLSFTTLFVVWTFCIPAGLAGAFFANRWHQKVMSFFCFAAMSLPTFFIAFISLYLASFTQSIPIGGIRSPYYDDLTFIGKCADLLRHLALPVTVLSISTAAGLTRIFKSNAESVLKSSLVQTLRARGVRRRRIMFAHVLRNALNPMVTILGYQFAGLLSGAALTEIILGWPGIGSLMLEAVLQQDIYLVMAELMIASCMLLAGNIASDILLAYLDPRIKARLW